MGRTSPAAERTALATAPTYQTVRLGAGRHKSPDGGVVCVMELASMLADERFSDRPKAVCAALAGLLRAYNDEIDNRRRNDLYQYASDTVGTRIDRTLQERRAETAIAWARPRWETRGWLA